MGRGLDSILAQGDVDLVVDEPAAPETAPAAPDTAAAGKGKAGGRDPVAGAVSGVVAEEGAAEGEPEALDAPAKDAKVEPPKKEEDKPTSAAFAALARKRQEIRAREESHTAERARFEQDARAFQASVQRFQADVQTFARERAATETKLKEQADAHVAQLAKVFTEKDAFFEAAEKAGVTAEDLRDWATGKMTRRAAPPPPPPKGMTQEEIDARLEERLKREREDWQKSAAQREAQAAAAAAEAQFASFVEKDDKTYEAANLVYTRTEIVALGNRIATAAHSRGLNWGWTEVASAVNEHAENDPRYQKIMARRSATTAGTAAGAGIPIGKAGASTKPESRSATTTTASEPRSTESATSRRPAHRKRHDERLSRVLGTAGARFGER